VQKTDPATGEEYWTLEPEGRPLAAIGTPKTGGPPPDSILSGMFLSGVYSVAAGLMFRRKVFGRRGRKRE
jgi:hypothetical protein